MVGRKFSGGLIIKINETVTTLSDVDKTSATKQIQFTVGGCDVKLNFPCKSEPIIIADVKEMILGGIAKT